MDYIKESTGDIKRMTLIADLLEDHIIPFCGCENLAYESFLVGARGWISVIANVAPKMSVELFNLAVKQRDYDKAWALYRKILPMLRYLEGAGTLWQTIKYVQDKIGLSGGFCRSPRQPLEKSDKDEIDALLSRYPLE
jgi:4-hydroxy-tetrahydrodipicolinate synthase